MKKVLKIIAPGVFLLWVVYFIEVVIQKKIFDLPFFNSEHLILNLKLFFTYTLFGIISGFIASGALLKKKERFGKTEFFKKNYFKYFALSFVICFIILLSFVLRELIIQPALYKQTLLRGGFFTQIMYFITTSFKPLYFTSVLVVIFSYSVYRIVTIYEVKRGLVRFILFLISASCFIYLVFGYGSLYANTKKINSKFNLMVVGVEGLNISTSRNLFERYSAFKKLNKSAYVFKNFFAESPGWKKNLLSLFYGRHPLNLNFIGLKSLQEYNNSEGYTFYSKDKSIVDLLNNCSLHNLILTDQKYSDLENYTGNFQKKIIPAKKQTTDRDKILKSHIVLLSLSSNDVFYSIIPEVSSLEGYREKEYYRENVVNHISDNKENFSIFYFLENSPEKLPYPYYLEVDSKNPDYVFKDYINEEMEIIINNLEEAGILNKTVILFTGLPEEESYDALNLKIPVLLYIPELGKKREISNNFSFSDLMPTLYQILTGFDISDQTEGQSLISKDFQQKSILTVNNKEASLIRGDYRLKVKLNENSVEYSLYNLKNDLAEKNNLAAVNRKLTHKLIKKFEQEVKSKLNLTILGGFPLLDKKVKL